MNKQHKIHYTQHYPKHPLNPKHMYTIQYKTMQCNAVQYNTTQHNTQYNTTQYNTVWCNAMQYNTTCTIQCNPILYGAIQWNTIRYDTIQYDTIQYDTIQYKVLPKSLTYYINGIGLFSSQPTGLYLDYLFYRSTVCIQQHDSETQHTARKMFIFLSGL